ncbi:MAG: FumA C-terminus/TtdB family hydratase beta subunit [Clostridiales bacterium]|jgi:fumarate hydratase subunit beta|nr:FumA C-terminus/TtdB family hydratase beta subunit [Clostridiales bacterium]
MNIKALRLPLTKEELQSLNAGEIVSLSGACYTARDAAHKRICDALKNGGPLPFDLDGACIYYCGPAPARDGEIIGSCGPTTSARMDDYAPTLLECGVAVMIGKGRRSDAVTKATADAGAVYLAAVGGAGALIKNRVKACALHAYPDLGCEAVYKLDLQNLELLVASDTKGVCALR